VGAFAPPFPLRFEATYQSQNVLRSEAEKVDASARPNLLDARGWMRDGSSVKDPDTGQK
jgi:hypothetical protein